MLRRILPALGLLLILSVPVYALQPDQILLIVNRNVPAGKSLAQFYARQRHVPIKQLVELDLPPTEQMTFEQYERQVVPPVRQFLLDNHLRDKVTCLLTFYGVPIRVAARVASPADESELRALRMQQATLRLQLDLTVARLEQTAAAADKAFRPQTSMPQAADPAARAQAAFNWINQKMPADPAARATLEKQAAELLQNLGGPAAMLRQFGAAQMLDARTDAAAKQRWMLLAERIEHAEKLIGDLRQRRYDPDARERLRMLLTENFGLIQSVELLQSQLDYLQGGNTTAATDNELALLWWDSYPRGNWQPNLLNWRNTQLGASPTMMVMRLDGPQSGTARDIVLASLAAEKKGLNGKVVIDARGIPAVNAKKQADAYGQFDQLLRDLDVIATKHTKLAVVMDDAPAVLQPHAVAQVANYCGWYSVGNYVPACQFVPGAVGYHIASFEMVSLRDPNNHGWVKGMLSDGIAATLGPVAEPFLHSFPHPDEFFPLLWSGKLTLAEVYWRTTPMTSWMICAIGDPLYNPYAAHPAIDAAEVQPMLDAIARQAK